MQEIVSVWVREMSVLGYFYILALLEDQGQTNTPHPCVQQKKRKRWIPNGNTRDGWNKKGERGSQKMSEEMNP